MPSTRDKLGLLAVVVVATFAVVLIILQDKHRPSDPKRAAPQFTSIESQTRLAKALTGIARVVDGDTVAIHGKRIRLNGVDAPESQQVCESNGQEYPCGERATEALIALLAGQTTECVEVTRDRYQRIVARCQVGSTDVAGWMVENGWAIAYRKYSLDYVEAEQRAQSQKSGMWAGIFTQPEEWRRIKAMERTHVQR